jgi:hypothetical protein
LRNEYYRDPALPILLGDEALAMGLLFKLLAQGRNVAAIETCARGIEAMAREEAAFLAGDGLLTIGFRRQARTTSYSDNMFKEENENASTIYGHYRTRRGRFYFFMSTARYRKPGQHCRRGANQSD